MPNETPPIDIDATDVLDTALMACLSELAEIAPVDDPRRLLDLLPAGAPEHHEFLLGELIKLDMAAAAETGGPPLMLEWYADALPEHIAVDRMPLDLVIEELQLRRESGEEVETADCVARFPQYAEVLGQFSGDAASVTATHQTKPPEEIEEGVQLDDFLIVQALGKGAFAHVYLATQQSMQRLVALKVSRGTGDEPQALAQLDHPNIVRVYDQRTVDGGAKHLLYMQYQPGGTLAEVVRMIRQTPPERRSGSQLLVSVDQQLLSAAQSTPERSTVRAWLADASWPMAVAWVGVQLARALDEAHRCGVLHRDVKPANVLLSAEGIPKLADFNVSFAGAAGRAGAAASFGGSIGYMSPEHLRAVSVETLAAPETVAEPADVYSLGVLLWELWQGRRPFDSDEQPSSWPEAVEQQLASRTEQLLPPVRTGGGGERALEQTLRQTLAPEIGDRPANGAELAGRLRLALHPEAAELFDPEQRSWPQRMLALSPWLLAAAAVLLPNILAGLFNFFYNEREIIQTHPTMRPGFEKLAMVVNSIAFPLGGFLTLWFTRPVARAIAAAKRGESPEPGAIDSLFGLTHRAALIGGVLWGVASVVYPVFLRAWYSEVFSPWEAMHFTMSLLICGGVAAVYPYFAILWLASDVYYPKLIRQTMSDPSFDRRADEVRGRSIGYLFAAAMIPLLSIALLVSRRGDLAVDVVRYAVVATAVGLLAAFSIRQRALATWDRMAAVLSKRWASQTPGLGDED